MAVDSDLFFDALIRRHVDENPRFVRRDWLAQALDEKLREPDKRFVLLTAEPGAGKSVFMAQLAHDHPEWLRYFVRRDQRSVLEDVSARSLLLRSGYQLAGRHPELFSEHELRVSVKQRFGEVTDGGEAVGVEVGKLVATPFYRMALQIEQSIEVNRGKVVGLRVEELYVEERLLLNDDLLHLALVDPARALQRVNPKQQLIILIDAVDEIRYHAVTENIVAWLTNCPALPENIRFVLSSRPPDAALNLFRTKQSDLLTELAITKGDTHVEEDVQRFVQHLIAEPAVAQTLQRAEGGAQAFAQNAAAKAHGNLGYLDALARGIDQALARNDATTLQSLVSLKELPADLQGLYAFFLHQIKADVARERIEVIDRESGEAYDKPIWPTVYDRVLGILAVAIRPLELELIVRLSGIQAERVWIGNALGRLLQFLDITDGRYSLYHATVAEFLTSEATAASTTASDLYIDAQKSHRKIADYYWSQRADWSRCDTYGLEALATHLYEAQDSARLAMLISQEWMQVRIATYHFAGFISDVERAWRLALLRDDESGFGESVRCALIRTSFNSVSRNYPPQLVARAIETGLWTSERAFSVASNMSERAAVALWSAVLATHTLSPADSARAEQMALAQAKQIHDSGERALTFANLAGSLDGEIRADAVRLGLGAAREVVNSSARAKALTQFASLSGGEEQSHRLLEVLMTINDVPGWPSDWERSFALRDLSPLLNPDLASLALEHANALTNAQARAAAQAALISRLSSDRTEAVAQDVLESVRRGLGHLFDQQSGGSHRNEADPPSVHECLERLKAVACFLSPSAKRQLLFQDGAAWLRSFDRDAAFRWFFEIVPRTDAQLATEAVHRAGSILAPGKKAEAYTSLAPLLSKEDRDRLFKETEAALQMAHPVERLRLANAWLPDADGQTKQGLVRSTLMAAFELAGPASVTHLDLETAAIMVGPVKGVLPHTPQDLIEDTLRLVMTPGLRPFRHELLTQLAPKLSGDVLRDALTIVGEIEDQYARVAAICDMARQLTDAATGESLRYAVDTLFQIANSYQLAKAGAKLAPLLDDEERRRVLRAALNGAKRSSPYAPLALAALAPHLTEDLVEEGVDAARQLVGDLPGSRQEGLAAMAARLTGTAKIQLIAEIFDSLERFDDSARSRILKRLVPNCDGDLLQKCWMTAKRLTDPSQRASVLADTAARLTGNDREAALREAEEAAAKIRSPFDRAMVTATLAELLTGGAKTRAIARALELTASVEQPHWHANALVALLPSLSGDAGQKVVSAAFERLNKVEDFGQIQALEALIPHLPAGTLGRAATLATSIADSSARARVLAALCRRLVQQSTDGQGRRFVLREIGAWLFSLRSVDRPTVLSFCGACLFDGAVVTQEALASIAGHVREITGQWRFEPAVTVPRPSIQSANIGAAGLSAV